MKKLLLLSLIAIAGSLQTIRATDLEECELILAERVSERTGNRDEWNQLTDKEKEDSLINGLFYELSAEEPYNLGGRLPDSPAAKKSPAENAKAMACLHTYLNRPGGYWDRQMQHKAQRAAQSEKIILP